MELLFGVILAVVLVSFLLALVLLIIPTWRIFAKAGEAGWKSLIPIYNGYVMVIISGLPWWVFLGFFIPVVNIVAAIFVMYYLSQRFGHGMGYGLGMIFLPFIFLPILGYGSSVYTPLSEGEAPSASPEPSSAGTPPENPVAA
jgi:hypothetical protein